MSSECHSRMARQPHTQEVHHRPSSLHVTQHQVPLQGQGCSPVDESRSAPTARALVTSGPRSRSTSRPRSMDSVREDLIGTSAVIISMAGTDQAHCRSGVRFSPRCLPDAFLARLTFLDVPQSFLDQNAITVKNFSKNPQNYCDSSSWSPTLYYPSGAFHGWARSKCTRRPQSRSAGDLASMLGIRNEWLWAETVPATKAVSSRGGGNRAAQRPSIEDMPFEILGICAHFFQPPSTSAD